MLANMKNPDEPALPIYDAANPPDFPDCISVRPARRRPGDHRSRAVVQRAQRQLRTSKENMRRFIKEEVEFSMGTDTGAFMDFLQEDPNAAELMYMVEMGMVPMKTIEAGTRNGAKALGLLKDFSAPSRKGSSRTSSWWPAIRSQNMAAMKRVAYVIKGGVRYK